jgi:hypothetical protein
MSQMKSHTSLKLEKFTVRKGCYLVIAGSAENHKLAQTVFKATQKALELQKQFVRSTRTIRNIDFDKNGLEHPDTVAEKVDAIIKESFGPDNEQAVILHTMNLAAVDAFHFEGSVKNILIAKKGLIQSLTEDEVKEVQADLASNIQYLSEILISRGLWIKE